MANPGVAGSQIPAGEDFAQRQIKDLQRDLRELAPSIAKSFAPVIADLTAKQAAIEANLASINDLLTKVVKPQHIYNTTDSYAVTTTETTRASVTVTVPAGFTAAVVSVMGRVEGRNLNATGGWNAAGGDLLYTRAWIGGSPGLNMDLSVLGSGDHAVSVMPLATVLTGLTPGSAFVLAAKVWSEYQNWAADAKNIAEISGTVTWYR